MLAFHPLMIQLSSQALADTFLVLVLALTALAACWLADRPTWPRALLLGTLLGLGGLIKLSPLLLAIPLAGLGVLLLVAAAPALAAAPRRLLTRLLGGWANGCCRCRGGLHRLRRRLSLPLARSHWPDLSPLRVPDARDGPAGGEWPTVAIGSREEASRADMVDTRRAVFPRRAAGGCGSTPRRRAVGCSTSSSPSAASGRLLWLIWRSGLASPHGIGGRGPAWPGCPDCRSVCGSTTSGTTCRWSSSAR